MRLYRSNRDSLNKHKQVLIEHWKRIIQSFSELEVNCVLRYNLELDKKLKEISIPEKIIEVEITEIKNQIEALEAVSQYLYNREQLIEEPCFSFLDINVPETLHKGLAKNCPLAYSLLCGEVVIRLKSVKNETIDETYIRFILNFITKSTELFSSLGHFYGIKIFRELGVTFQRMNDPEKTQASHELALENFYFFKQNYEEEIIFIQNGYPGFSIEKLIQSQFHLDSIQELEGELKKSLYLDYLSQSPNCRHFC